MTATCIDDFVATGARCSHTTAATATASAGGQSPAPNVGHARGAAGEEGRGRDQLLVGDYCILPATRD